MFGNSFSRNIKGGAVIDGSANERQTQRYIDCLAEGKALDRNHSLVMITRHDGIELAARRAQKYGVGRKRPRNIDSIGDRALLDRGHDFSGFFNAEQPAFSSVWIQSCNCDPRVFDSPALQLAMGQADDFLETFAPDQSNRLRQRDMSRDQDDAQVGGDETHSIVMRPAKMCQEFSVTGKTVAAQEQSALVDRRGGDGGDTARGTQLDCRFDVLGGSFAGDGGFNTRLDVPLNVIEMKD